MEFRRVVERGSRLDRKHIHTDGGLPDGPEPVTFGEVGFGKESATHFHGGVPVTLHGPILGVTVRRRGPILTP